MSVVYIHSSVTNCKKLREEKNFVSHLKFEISDLLAIPLFHFRSGLATIPRRSGM
jgi:hypothetical protein